jgi:hypothetical protein
LCLIGHAPRILGFVVKRLGLEDPDAVLAEHHDRLP